MHTDIAVVHWPVQILLKAELDTTSTLTKARTLGRMFPWHRQRFIKYGTIEKLDLVVLVQPGYASSDIDNEELLQIPGGSITYISGNLVTNYYSGEVAKFKNRDYVLHVHSIFIDKSEGTISPITASLRSGNPGKLEEYAGSYPQGTFTAFRARTPVLALAKNKQG
jgi:hypothetical protein